MMGKKKTWGDLEKDDVVRAAGRDWRVVKIKRKGKKARVMLEHRGRYAESEVRAKDPVEVVKPKKLLDREGTQTRWATEAERAAALGKGNPKRTKPPAPAAGDPWETPAGRIERKLDEILGARLVGESKDEAEGYYVPPVDVSTVASHMAIFHGGVPERCANEIEILDAHDAQHAEAKSRGLALAVNHWHTERRP